MIFETRTGHERWRAPSLGAGRTLALFWIAFCLNCDPTAGALGRPPCRPMMRGCAAAPDLILGSSIPLAARGHTAAGPKGGVVVLCLPPRDPAGHELDSGRAGGHGSTPAAAVLPPGSQMPRASRRSCYRRAGSASAGLTVGGPPSRASPGEESRDCQQGRRRSFHSRSPPRGRSRPAAAAGEA